MIDFSKRLASLKERRQGSRERAIYDSMDSHSADFSVARGRDIRKAEPFELLNETAGVKYSIGAMAPVDTKSTNVSISEGNRVADSLINSLNAQSENLTKRLQGSVALDIHIKGHSDVDMLIIVNNPVIIELPKVPPSYYSPSTDPRSLINIAKEVRSKSEKTLPINFPKTDIDISGNKSIAMSGGSLSRKVDIVPAIWYDSREYQRTNQNHDRGIKIYHKKNHEFILNYPFKHIKLVHERDSIYSGNLKCCIRLIKNMVADMPEYKKSIAKKLTSYDLAAIGYHMNEELRVPSYMRLGLVEKIRAHLELLSISSEYRESLRVPDGSRVIFDESEKVSALKILHKEFSDLAKSIYSELAPYKTIYDSAIIMKKHVW